MNLEHHHPFSPNKAPGIGWPGPFSSQVPFGRGRQPSHPCPKNMGKYVNHLLNKNYLKFFFDSNAMKNTP